MLKKWEFGLARVYKKLEWKFLNKEFGSTYPCNRLLHRWLGREGEGSYRWLCRCSHVRFLFCTTCTAVLVMDDGDGAGCCDAVRT